MDWQTQPLSRCILPLTGRVAAVNGLEYKSEEAAPEKVMNDFKTYASRRLTEAGFDTRDRKRWTRHGSTKYIWTRRICKTLSIMSSKAKATQWKLTASEPRP